MRTTSLAALAAVLLAAAASAQEAQPEAVAAEEEQEMAPETRRPLRVLTNPYDISSFYRSAEGGLFFAPEPAGSERYPIAGYYRQRGGSGYGYSQFWTGGYSDRGRGRGRARLGIGYRRAIGENGDLFLFAPAFLAPVGPLTGIFFSEPPR